MLKLYRVCLSFLVLVTDVVRCTPDYSFSSEARGWLKLYKEPADFAAAFFICHDEGTVLASPLDKNLANALNTLMTQSGVNGDIFLGTHSILSKQENIFLSIEGVPLIHMGVTLTPHNEKTPAYCLSMSTTGRVNFTSCLDQLPFICYKRSVHQTINECGTFDNEYHHNSRTGSCYKVHTELLPWHRAFSACVSERGHLVILNNAEEASIIQGMFPDRPGKIDKFEQFHIGLFGWGINRTWITVHGEGIDDKFNEWDVEQPNNTRGEQNRASFRRLSGKMDDIGTAVKAMFVCHMGQLMFVVDVVPIESGPD